MVNKLKALAERVETYKKQAIETAQLMAFTKLMRADVFKAGSELGLTHAVMNDMLPTLKEAALLTAETTPMMTATEAMVAEGARAPRFLSFSEFNPGKSLVDFGGGDLRPQDGHFGGPGGGVGGDLAYSNERLPSDTEPTSANMFDIPGAVV